MSCTSQNERVQFDENAEDFNLIINLQGLKSDITLENGKSTPPKVNGVVENGHK